MNKKLIAVALAALPVAAMADVTLYGKIKVGVENTKTGNAGSINHIDDLGSRIGFKGSEDLGNGLKAIWQVEQAISVDNGGTGNTWATRDSFIGFQGDFGKVRLGRLSNYQNDSMEDVDPWNYSSPAMGLGTFTRNDTRYNNAIAYDSPEFAGFSGRVLYGVDEARTTVGSNRTNKDTWNVGLGYHFDAFFAKYSYIRQNDQNTDGDKANSSHRFEGGYNANNLYVVLGYQQTKSYGGSLSAANFIYKNAIGNSLVTDSATTGVTGNTEVKDREAALTVGYTFGAITPYISLAKGWDAKFDGVKDSDSGYKQYVIGAQYDLSKRTQLGVAYGKLNADGGKDFDVRAFGVNAVHSF
ncbi:porin [Pseudogulbenkiania ferrooxidans]|uniref:Porin Gram-negative type n=1 Tax=Pseudogulbenkiania ferrooxidans 2002 TaxID=279714 RepID=B9YZB9_9NEIS|nr:porin [Pseudogulbenkiania ferrooxidans]EEG10472.1 porin Gram-negative type [Pseudogulbenkiania ferrooxidans 2002]